MKPDFYIHPSAIVDDHVKIGNNTKIWHFSHVQSNTQLGANCSLGQNVNIGNNVTIGDNVTGFIRRTDLSRDRAEQRADRFAVGEKVDAIVTSVDKKTRKLSLSIQARESAEEKQAMAEFGSSDSDASLGDILGAALAKKETDDD